MITRYDQPAQYQAVNTYVPIPFQELALAGTAKQKRYEDTLAQEDAVLTDLSNIQALDRIVDPGTGAEIEVGEAKAVEARKQYYQDSINELTSTLGDKASPMYRAKLANKVRELRSDLSPQGIFGRAMGNYKTYQDIRKRLSESEDATKSPYLAYNVRNELMRYAQGAQEGVGYLAGQASIGKDPEVTKRLSDVMKNIQPIMTQRYAGIDDTGIIREGKMKEVTYKRAYDIAKELINQDKAITSSIEASAGWDRDVSGVDTNPEAEKERLARTMANMFTQSEGSASVDFSDAWAKRREDSQVIPTDVPINYGLPGKEVEDRQDLFNKIGSVESAIKDIDSRLLDYNKALAEQGENATIIDKQSGAEVPVASLRDRLMRERDAKLLEKEQYDDLHKQAARYAGLDEESIKRQFGEDAVAEAKRKARQEADKEKPIRIFGFETEGTYKTPYTELDYLYYLPGTKGTEMGSRYKKYEERLKESAKSKITNANTMLGSKKDIEEMDNDNMKSSLLSNGSLKWADTKHTGEDLLDKEYEQINAKNSVYRGYGISQHPSNKGQLEVYYDVYSNKQGDEEPVKLGTVRVKAPRLLEYKKVKSGELEAPGTGYRDVTDKVTNQFTKQTGVGRLNVAGTDMLIASPEQEGGQYRIGIPSDKTPGAYEFIGFDNLEAAVSAVNTIINSQQ